MIPDRQSREVADKCVESLARAFEAAASNDWAAAERALHPIAGEIWSGMPAWQKPTLSEPVSDAGGGRSFKPRVSAEVFVRDRFQCRYCGQRLFAVPMMSALSSAFPNELPYVHTYKSGFMHPAYWLVGAEADHLVPGSRGGSWTDSSNHVASCVFCNTRKSNFEIEELGVEEVPTANRDWTGCIDLYPAVWDFAGRPSESMHRKWMRAFEVARS